MISISPAPRHARSLWSLGLPALLLLGTAAREGSLRALAPGRRILHLASHAWIDAPVAARLGVDPSLDPEDPATLDRLRWLAQPLQRARLLLAPAPAGAPADPQDDGELSALEAARLDLEGVEVVVLSACGTADGEPVSGEWIEPVR